MILKKIYLKNIRSYKEGQVTFPEGSTLLMGDIGCGKTSILLAVEFALFGLQPGQKGNSILRNGENEALVKLEFSIDDKEISIERGLKKGGKSIAQTDTSIMINNEKVEGSVTEIKNKILSLLNYPPEFAKKTNDLYKFTVYTPQEEMKQIIQESSDTRLNTLRHVFGIDKYKRIEENIDIVTSRLRQEIKIKESLIGNIEQKKTSLKEKNDSLIIQHSNLDQAEKEIQQIKQLKQEKQAEIDQINTKIKEKATIQTEKVKAEVMLSTKRESISSLDREILFLKEQIKALSSIKFQESEIEILKTRIKSQEEILKNLNDAYIINITNLQGADSKIKELLILKNKISILEKCPTCLQIVGEDYKNNIVTKASMEADLLEKENQNRKKEKENISSQIDATKKHMEVLRHSLSEMEILKIKLESLKEKQLKIEQLEKQKLSLSGDADMIKTHIQDLEKVISEFSIYDTQFLQKNRELTDISLKENKAMINKAEINKEIQFLGRLITELEDQIKKIEEETKKLNYLKEIEYWLNNHLLELVLFTEKNVMLKLREEFSNLFSNWFSILVPESITVRLDESFSPIIQQSDYDIDYNYLSGGEKTAIALAYRLALNQVINSLLSKIKTRDLVILDEPTDGFSDAQLDKMRDIFEQLKIKQLILVSHEQKIEGFVDNIVRFKKSNGATEIEISSKI